MPLTENMHLTDIGNQIPTDIQPERIFLLMIVSWVTHLKKLFMRKIRISVHKRFPALMITTLFLSICFSATSVMADKLFIPPINAQSGEEVIVPVKIDRVDNLAGIKIVLTYNNNLLVYKKMVPSAATKSLMHVVNDKNPGRLIIVMAGAKGIQAKDTVLLNLHFKVIEKLQKTLTTNIEIAELQLMTDQLKNLEYNLEINPLTLYPVNNLSLTGDDEK